MNSLDRAFIRAYARDLNVDSLNAAAAQRESTRRESTQRDHRESTQPQSVTATAEPRRAATPPTTTAPPCDPLASEPLVQVSYADGSWIRIEQHEQAAAKVTTPHIPCQPKDKPPAVEECPTTAESPAAPATTAEPVASPQQSMDDDVDLLARFRPPLFRNVDLRSHEHAVAVKAEAIAAQAEAIATPSLDEQAPSMPSLDYTLAPPSPPVAPRVPPSEITSDDTTTGRGQIKVAVSPFAELAREKAQPKVEKGARLSAKELHEYAAQCQQLRSVVLDMPGIDNLDSPEEAHVMLVDVPLELIESQAEREQKKLDAEQLARKREAMLSALMQQELIVGDACDPQWLYGSESPAPLNYEHECPAKKEQARASEVEAPAYGCSFTSLAGQELDEKAALLRSIDKQVTERGHESPAGSLNMEARLVDSESSRTDEDLLLEFTHDFVEEMASEVAPESEPAVTEPVASEPANTAPANTEPVVAENVQEDSAEAEASHQAAAAVAESSSTVEPPNEPQPPEQLSPAWEVDRIVWPIMTDQLLSDIGDQLGVAIETFQRTSAAHLVAVTGHQRGEGRTTLSICLARRAAQAGLRVALVDVDFAAPALAENLSLDTMTGWDRVLQSGTLLNEASIASLDDQLTIVPLEKPLTQHLVAESMQPFEMALAQLAESFDLVLLDAGPVGELLVEGSWLTKLTHKPGLMLTHDMREASLLEVQQTIELSQAMGVEVVGVAQTFAAKEEAA